MWKYYALLSAVFAALTAILAKCGVKNVDSNLATAIRTSVILMLTWSIVLVSGGISHIRELTWRSVAFLFASGIATGISWLFYFKALQCGDVSKVAPIDKLWSSSGSCSCMKNCRGRFSSGQRASSPGRCFF